MKNTTAILTIREIAETLRCSQAHVTNVISGNMRGVAKLAHIEVGRRKLVRREWVYSWMEANQTD